MKGKVMGKRLAVSLFLLLASVAWGQTTISHSFTFGNTPQLPGQGDCATFLSFDGVVNAYPYAMGENCFSDYPYRAGADFPFQLGYPNNGFLIDNTDDAFTAITWTVGNGT